MTVYLLHFAQPLGSQKHQAQHYVGFSTNSRTLKQRVAHHESGTSGVCIMRALRERGIAFTVAQVFKDKDRNFERKLKNTKNIKRYCPICNPKVRDYTPKEKL